MFKRMPGLGTQVHGWHGDALAPLDGGDLDSLPSGWMSTEGQGSASMGR